MKVKAVRSIPVLNLKLSQNFHIAVQALAGRGGGCGGATASNGGGAAATCGAATASHGGGATAIRRGATASRRGRRPRLEA